MSKFFKNNINHIAALLCVLYFLAMIVPLINVLGINIDDSMPSLMALDFLSQFMEGFSYQFDAGSSSYFIPGVDYFSIADVSVPVVMCPYEGAVTIWLLSFLLAVFNNLIFAIKLPHLIFAVITFISVYITVEKFFDRVSAFLTVLFLAVNTFYMEAVLVGNLKDEVLQVALFYLGLAFFSHLYVYKKHFYFYVAVGAFFWGVGLMAKFMFFGFLAPFILMAVSCQDVRRFFFKPKCLFCFALFFALGFLPIILYYLDGNFHIFIGFIKSLFIKSDVHNNINILENLQIRALDFKTFLEQNMMISINYAERFKVNNFYSLSLFVIAFVYFVYKKDKKVLSICLFYFMVWGLTIFVPNEMVESHMAILFPFVQIIQAVFFVSFFKDKIVKGKLKLVLVFMLLFPSVSFMAKNIKNNFMFASYIKENNVLSHWSNLIYPVCDYMQENNIKEIYSLCHFSNPYSIAYLTKREVLSRNFWIDNWHKDSYKTKDGVVKWFDKTSKDNTGSFYLLMDDMGVKKGLKPHIYMMELLKERNYKVEAVETFSDKYNRIIIYKVLK